MQPKKEQTMLPALLHPKHIFGFQPLVVDNLAFANEQTVFYVAGAVGVLHDVDLQVQRFVHLGRNKEVQAVQMSANRQYVAVAERATDQRTHVGVGIYDLVSLKRRRILGAARLSQQLQQPPTRDRGRAPRFVGLAFSGDGKFVAGQTGEHEWMLLLWEWDSNKLLATLSLAGHSPAITPIHQIAFHPHDYGQISVVGSGGWLLLRLEDGKTLTVACEQQFNAIGGTCWCHAWVADTRILIGADHGSVLLVEGNQIQHRLGIKQTSVDEISCPTFNKLEEPPESTCLEENPVTKLAIFSKGFLCSCNSDTVYLFERYAGGKVYRQAAAIKIPSSDREQHDETDPIRITVLVISPSEDVVAVATDHRRIYTFTLTNVDINKSLLPTFEPLTPCFHRRSLLDIDICLRKPIAVTCSSDRALSVWNYATNQQQLFKYEDEDVLSVALHPTGLYLLVGYATKLRLMGLMIDDFRVVHEFSVKECRVCAFSHGGHLIAAVLGSSILVYSTVTFDTMASLKGHLGKVTSIGWTFDDLKLVSCSVDGSVFEWDVHSCKRTSEVNIKSCCCNGVAVARDNCTSFVVGSDDTVREIAESQVLGEVALSSSSTLTSVVALHCGKALFTGSALGTMWVVPIPLPNQDEWQEFQPLSTDIVKVKLTPDDKWLLTISTDGSLGILKVTDKDGHSFQSDEELPFLEEILITRADLEEKNLTISELGHQIREVTNQSEYQRRLKEQEHQAYIKEQEAHYQKWISDLKKNLENLENVNLRLTEHHERSQLEKEGQHQKVVENMLLDNEQKLMMEYDKYEELEMKCERLATDFQQKANHLECEKAQAIKEIMSQCERRVQESNAKLEKAEKELLRTKKKCEEATRLIEEDADQEIQNIKKNYDQQLLEAKESSSKIKAEIGILKKKLLSMQRELDNQNDEIRRGNCDQQMLQSVIQQLQQDINKLTAEVLDRDNLLFNREQKFYELKRRNAELVKFKVLLELKIQEMDNQIQPINKSMAQMQKCLNEKMTELKLAKQSNTKMELKNNTLKLKLQVLTNSCKTGQHKYISR